MNWFIYGYQNLGVKLKNFSTHIILIVFTDSKRNNFNESWRKGIAGIGRLKIKVKTLHWNFMINQTINIIKTSEIQKWN